MKKRTKRRLIDTGVLLVIFVAAIVLFSHFTNKGNESMTADMGAATFPQVSFVYDGYAINDTPGYAREMDLTAVRDTITPAINGRVGIEIDAHDNKIEGLKAEVYTLNGQEVLFEDKLELAGESVALLIEDDTILDDERMLKLTLEMEDGKQIFYYTRIVDSADSELLSCLDYIRAFHENTLKKAEGAGIGTAIEPNEEGDNTNFHYVNIHSNYDHVTWGELEPQVEGGERWSIKEMNSVYTSVQLEYHVHCKGEENEMDEYKVQEFYRVRHIASAQKTYLLDYEREMEQIFNPAQKAINEKGVLLGITDPEVPYLVSGDGTIVAFVQADELWCYNKDRDEASLVYSFAATENTDERNRISQHEIRLLEADNAGNLTFAVYGYMNRGFHEGEVGIAVYSYNHEQSSVEEKAFVSTDKSYAHVLNEFGEMLYYHAEEDDLYILVDGTIYRMNLELNTQELIVEGLTEEQYIISEDGTVMAYQTGAAAESQELIVRNFASGKEFSVKCAEDECVRPLGFMDKDIVYGIAKKADIGQTVAGEPVIPLYKVEISSLKGEVIKTYEQAGIYVLDADFDKNMITLHRAQKTGDAYQSVEDDYITNNEEKEESNIFLESYTTELKKRQMRLTFSNGVSDKEPKLLKPKQVMEKTMREITFDDLETKQKCYVYGFGKMQGIYDKAGEAILAAEECSGVVVSWEQDYIWERGNRDLQHYLGEEDANVQAILSSLQNGDSPVNIMETISDGNSLNLTGCTTEELLYVINQGSPIIGMLNAGQSVILIGYNKENVSYIDASTGGKAEVSFEQMDQMTAGSGHTYIGMLN